MKRAKKYDEIAPLAELCKLGKLFDVQAWIAAGKPINLPAKMERRKKSPLEIAMDGGFHSFVQILLEAGASINEPGYFPLEHALSKRRFDLVMLLVENGVPINSVDMLSVFETWNPEIVEYFIERGADLEDGNPLAGAFCSRIRTALGIFKRHEKKLPALREQVNIALRYHCREGNLKWVSLMLWAGGDPYSRGPDSPWNGDGEDYFNALELAALRGHIDIFSLKAVKLDPSREDAGELLRSCCLLGKADILKMLLNRGYDPDKMEDKGTTLINSLASGMTWGFNPWTYERKKKDIDTSDARDRMKMIHMLVRSGAQWMPRDEDSIGYLRRSFLKMKADYAMEFIWIMSEYKACTRKTLETFVKTPSIRSLLSSHTDRLAEIMVPLPEKLDGSG